MGLMPGPKKPRTYDINNYLRPLVDELIELYKGVKMKTYLHPNNPIIVKAALLMVACDTPAARKVSRFTSHNSRRACYKCDRSFETSLVTKRIDCSGFDVSIWKRRTWKDNVEQAEEWKAAATARDQERLEHSSGTRWSELHRLLYFDIVRCSVIDPMHNLLLGTVKRMVEMWIDRGNIKADDLEAMEALADGLLLPPEFDILPKEKISGRLSNLKAAERKSWCLIYSPSLLKKVLSQRAYTHWRKFVNACRYLLKPSITYGEAEKAHKLLVEFCKECQQLYTPASITVNMHLHCHLYETILDFGPVYASWLFSFERYNGLLGSIESNRKGAFEATSMKRFLELTHAADYVQRVSSHLAPEQSAFLLDLVNNPPTSTTTARLASADAFNVDEYIQTSTAIRHASGAEPLPPGALIGKTKGVRMPREHYKALLEIYKVAYGEYQSEGDYQDPKPGQAIVQLYITMFNTLRLQGHTYRSVAGQSNRGSFIQALYEESVSGVPAAYPGQVMFYFIYDYAVRNATRTHVFAFVRWFQRHRGSQPFEDACLDVWKDSFEPINWQSVSPVSRIYSPIAIAKYKTAGAGATVVVVPFAKQSHA